MSNVVDFETEKKGNFQTYVEPASAYETEALPRQGLKRQMKSRHIAMM